MSERVNHFYYQPVDGETTQHQEQQTRGKGGGGVTAKDFFAFIVVLVHPTMSD